MITALAPNAGGRSVVYCIPVYCQDLERQNGSFDFDRQPVPPGRNSHYNAANYACQLPPCTNPTFCMTLRVLESLKCPNKIRTGLLLASSMYIVAFLPATGVLRFAHQKHCGVQHVYEARQLQLFSCASAPTHWPASTTVTRVIA